MQTTVRIYLALLLSAFVSLMWYVASVFAIHGKPGPVVVPRPAVPDFIVAVDQQPWDSFSKWKSLGVNTVLDVPEGHDIKQWSDAAEKIGMFQMRHPLDLATDYATYPHLIAYTHDDEPDLKGTLASVLLANKLKAAAVPLPWFVNFDGSRVLGIQPKVSASTYPELCQAANWFSNDIYPVSGWDNNIDLFKVGDAIDAVKIASADGVQFAYVEMSRQACPWLPNGGREPTPDEISCIIRQCRSHGVKGIILFPLKPFQGFAFDSSSPAAKNCVAGWAEVLTRK